jgi:hypothetical protein
MMRSAVEMLKRIVKTALKKRKKTQSQKMKDLSAFGMFAKFGIITRVASRMTSAVLLISVLFIPRFVNTRGMQTIVTLKTAKLWSES